MIYWINCRPERSASMERFVRLLDKKWEEDLEYALLEV